MVAVAVADPTQVAAWATAGAGGGIWGPGGVASDGTNVYVTTGNTMGVAANAWAGGEALLRLTPDARFSSPASWTPGNWHLLDDGDVDLGGTGPLIIDVAAATPAHLAVALGKDGNAYLLDRTSLGGIAAPLAMLHAASNEIIGAAASYTTASATYVVFRARGVACTSGGGDLTAIKIMPGTPPGLAASWCAVGGAGAPIATTTDGQADAIVWNVRAETSSSTLAAFDGDTGAVITFPGGSVAIPGTHRYGSPIVAKGRMYVVSDAGIVAFKL